MGDFWRSPSPRSYPMSDPPPESRLKDKARLLRLAQSIKTRPKSKSQQGRSKRRLDFQDDPSYTNIEHLVFERAQLVRTGPLETGTGGWSSPAVIHSPEPPKYDTWDNYPASNGSSPGKDQELHNKDCGQNSVSRTQILNDIHTIGHADKIVNVTEREGADTHTPHDDSIPGISGPKQGPSIALPAVVDIPQPGVVKRSSSDTGRKMFEMLQFFTPEKSASDEVDEGTCTVQIPSPIYSPRDITIIYPSDADEVITKPVKISMQVPETNVCACGESPTLQYHSSGKTLSQMPLPNEAPSPIHSPTTPTYDSPTPKGLRLSLATPDDLPQQPAPAVDCPKSRNETVCMNGQNVAPKACKQQSQDGKHKPSSSIQRPSRVTPPKIKTGTADKSRQISPATRESPAASGCNLPKPGGAPTASSVKPRAASAARRTFSNCTVSPASSRTQSSESLSIGRRLSESSASSRWSVGSQGSSPRTQAKRSVSVRDPPQATRRYQSRQSGPKNQSAQDTKDSKGLVGVPRKSVSSHMPPSGGKPSMLPVPVTSHHNTSTASVAGTSRTAYQRSTSLRVPNGIPSPTVRRKSAGEARVQEQQARKTASGIAVRSRNKVQRVPTKGVSPRGSSASFYVALPESDSTGLKTPSKGVTSLTAKSSRPCQVSRKKLVDPNETKVDAVSGQEPNNAVANGEHNLYEDACVNQHASEEKTCADCSAEAMIPTQNSPLEHPQCDKAECTSEPCEPNGPYPCNKQHHVPLMQQRSNSLPKSFLSEKYGILGIKVALPR